MRTIIQRARAATPPFFQKLRNIGLAIAGVATALLTAPVSLPAVVTTIAGYIVTAGAVTAAVSQLTVPTDARSKKLKQRSQKGGADVHTGKP